MARDAALGRPTIGCAAIRRSPDAGKPSEERTQGGCRGTEYRKAQLDVGPDEELVVKVVNVLALGMTKLDEDGQFCDCGGACTVVMALSALALTEIKIGGLGS